MFHQYSVLYKHKNIGLFIVFILPWASFLSDERLLVQISVEKAASRPLEKAVESNYP